MSITRFQLLVAASTLCATSAFAQITPGNLLVSRVGDGSAALTSAATARFLDEYTPAGVFVQTIALPTSASGNNRQLTDSGSATSDGFVSQSADGRYLLTAGYDAAVGTPSVAGTTAAVANRVIARIALDGTIDSSTALTDAYSGNNIRSVVSVDGNSFWTSGTASAANGPGVRYIANLGDTTSTQLSTSVTNIRGTGIFDGQLYCSSSSGAFQGVSVVGTGLPTASGETITLLNGFPTATGPSAYDFFFADSNTLYVADDRVAPNGGIQRWSYDTVNTIWTLDYTLNTPNGVGCRGLSGTVDNGVATLFATTVDNLVVSVSDTGAASTVTTLVIGATNTFVRDVQFVRTPSSVTHSGTSCATSLGTPGIGTSGGNPVAGNLGFGFTASNTGALSFVIVMLQAGQPLPFGVQIPGAPACALTYVIPAILPGGFADNNGDFGTPLPIPGNSSLGGADISAQAVVFDLSLVGYSLPIGTSDAVTIVVGN